ncbi:DNA-binding helix-turn-helix protein [Streptococcus pluranimalium]
MSKFASRLKELRKKHGLTQKEIAKLIGISQSSYSNWENGNREPSLENVVRLAKLFGVTTDYLLGRYK